MELRVGEWVLGEGEHAVMASAPRLGPDRRLDGADIIEIAPDPALVERAREQHPGLVIAVALPGWPESGHPRSEGGTGTEERIENERSTAADMEPIAYECVAAGAGLLAGDALAPVAATTGTALICSDPDAALAVGVRPDGILVELPAGDDPWQAVRRLANEGHQVVATPHRIAGGAGTGPGELAVIAICRWLGVRVVRMTDPAALAPAHDALDIIAAIRGDRQPTVSRRALA